MSLGDFLMDQSDEVFKGAEFREKAQAEIEAARQEGMPRKEVMRWLNYLVAWDVDDTEVPNPQDVYNQVGRWRVEFGNRMTDPGDLVPSSETVAKRVETVAQEARAAARSLASEATAGIWDKTPWWVMALVALGGTYALLRGAVAVVVTVRELRTGTAVRP